MALFAILDISKKLLKVSELLSPVTLELLDASAAVAGVGLGTHLAHRMTSVAYSAYRAGGDAARSELQKRLYESSTRSRFVCERILVLGKQADALGACLTPSTLADALSVFNELVRFIEKTLPEMPLAQARYKAARKRLARFYNAFVANERRLTELADIMQRVNAAFAACLSDALVVMSFYALKSNELTAQFIDGDFAEIAVTCAADKAEQRREKKQAALAAAALAAKAAAADAVRMPRRALKFLFRDPRDSTDAADSTSLTKVVSDGQADRWLEDVLSNPTPVPASELERDTLLTRTNQESEKAEHERASFSREVEVELDKRVEVEVEVEGGGRKLQRRPRSRPRPQTSASPAPEATASSKNKRKLARSRSRERNRDMDRETTKKRS